VDRRGVRGNPIVPGSGVFEPLSLLRIPVLFDVPAERQSFVEFAMMNDANPAVVNDKNGDSKINFFVDVGHGFGQQFVVSSQ
jgi:hypothetical protein